MYNTLNYLKSFRKENLKDFSNASLAFKYQEKKDDAIIAEIFIKNFGFLLKFSRQVNIENEDKASIILNSIYKALDNYDGSHSFLTFLGVIIRNEFGRYKILSKFKNRMTIIVSVNEKNKDNNEYINSIEDIEYKQDIEYRLLTEDLLNIKELTSNQKQILKIIIKDPEISSLEIAKKLGVCGVYIGKEIKKIKIKLKGYFLN